MNKLLKAIFFTLYLLVSRIGHATEWRKVVAVVDTGMPAGSIITPYLCNMKHFDLTGFGIEDHHGHGSNIAYIITSHMNRRTHCLWIIKWWDTEKTTTGPKLNDLVKGYVALLDTYRPAFVNLSLSGANYFSYESNVLKGLLKTGTTVIVSAGNDYLNLDTSCSSYPACYNIHDPNFHVVGARNVLTGSIEPYSNRGRVVTDYESGNACTFNICYSGTSQSAAHLTSRLISVKVIKGDN